MCLRGDLKGGGICLEVGVIIFGIGLKRRGVILFGLDMCFSCLQSDLFEIRNFLVGMGGLSGLKEHRFELIFMSYGLAKFFLNFVYWFWNHYFIWISNLIIKQLEVNEDLLNTMKAFFSHQTPNHFLTYPSFDDFSLSLKPSLW